MSGPQDINAQTMVWRPRLIKVTQVVQPELDDGKPTVAFINPECIDKISRMVIGWTKRDGTGQWPDQSVTGVSMHSQGVLFIVESPEEVAKMRDQAFGYENGKPALKSV